MPISWCFFPGSDAAVNLAREEALYESFDEPTVTIVFYVNSKCLVVGRHQNPWREIDLAEARRNDVPVLRRMSGGGTVYHDEGNLVFSIMTSREKFDRARNLEVVRRALASLGVGCEPEGTYDLYLAGRKVSGNSFRFHRDRAVHHGTLLVDADRTLLARLLKRDEPAVVTHAVASRPAHTVNIREISPGFDVASLPEAIVREAIAEYAPAGERIAIPSDAASIDPARVAELAERNRSWEWTYGRTPEFTVTLTADDDPTAAPLVLRVKQGIVEDAEGPPGAELLRGARFLREELESRLDGADRFLRSIVASSHLL